MCITVSLGLVCHDLITNQSWQIWCNESPPARPLRLYYSECLFLSAVPTEGILPRNVSGSPEVIPGSLLPTFLCREPIWMTILMTHVSIRRAFRHVSIHRPHASGLRHISLITNYTDKPKNDVYFYFSFIHYTGSERTFYLWKSLHLQCCLRLMFSVSHCDL